MVDIGGLSEELQRCSSELQQIVGRADWLLDPKSTEAQRAAEAARGFVKLFFDTCQAQSRVKTGLEHLVVEGFEHEQIWEELEVQNVPLRLKLRKRLTKLSAQADIDLSVSVPQVDADEKEDEVLEPKELKRKAKKPKAPPGDGSEEATPSKLKDKAAKPAEAEAEAEAEEADEKAPEDFFSMEDMEKFTSMADDGKMRLDEDAEESDFDLLEAGDDDDEAGKITFNDFFGGNEPEKVQAHDKQPLEEEETNDGDEEAASELEDLEEEEQALEAQIKALQEGEGEEEEEQEEDEEAEVKDEGKLSASKGKSLYEMDRHLKSLEEEVKKLEEEQLQEKTWEMKGEVSARQRPLNSLLEVALDQPMTHFAARRAEELAGEGDADEEAMEDAPGADELAKSSKLDLEAIIKQRVWDESFDDVVRKTQLPPSQRPDDEDTVETLNFQKSRVGLGDIYAKQYEAEFLGHATDSQKAEDKEKAEIKEIFVKLMFKLDQLSNAHFTPRPPMLGGGEQKAPALKMEETIPLMVSDATLQAPEERKAPRRHVKDHSELAHDEKTAVRRSKKAARKKSLERKVEAGQMSLKGRRERDQKLQEKNKAAKAEKAAQGEVKDPKKRLKASELLQQAAENSKSDISKKEEAGLRGSHHVNFFSTCDADIFR
ncbi:unnamed protein product [Effrenium voratum]|uniref:Uncharacterized protein n=1 Tax=Effrenium voratum TaxID=2562239 RepID=A0AA36JEB0_9DINO|nr:unnamed protein product [Effrenium voratum]